MSDVTITVRVQTGWLRFIVAIATHLSDWHLPALAALWLWLMQPLFIIRIQVAGKRWRFAHIPLRVTLQFHPRRPPNTP